MEQRRGSRMRTLQVIEAEDRPDAGRLPIGSTVYAVLRRLIVLGRLRQGAALVELQLAAELGCSQGVVREALLRLQDDGLVVREGYRGSSVSTTLAVEAHELIALRRRLERLGVRHGLARLDEATLADLAGQVEAMERLADGDDLYGLTDADRTFHLAIFRLAGFTALEPILARSFLIVHRYAIAIANPARRRSLMATARRHWAIVEALATRDPPRAAAALELHIDTVIEGLPPAAEEQAA